MTTQDKFIFILTFITGLAAGMYVYVISFKPTYAPETINNVEELAEDFSVIGKQYAGDRQNDYVAPSFRITADGSFSYRPGGSTTDGLEIIEGKLPRTLINDLRSLATFDELDRLSENNPAGDCQSFVDGIDYQYRIILESEEFQLDSCDTRLGYDSDLALALEDVWNYLDDPSVEAGGSLFGNSFYDTSVNFIRDNLSPYEE